MEPDEARKKEDAREHEAFSLVKRAKSFTHAGRGVRIFIKTTHNAWIHLLVLAAVIAAGFYFRISSVEWMFVVFAAGLVLAAEAFNTAMEIDIDLTSPNYHPYARDTKDVAAGAVLIASITAALIGVLIFGHYFLALPLFHSVKSSPCTLEECPLSLDESDSGGTFTYGVTSRFSVILDERANPKKNLRCAPEGVIGSVSNTPSIAPPLYAARFEGVVPGTCTLTDDHFSASIVVADE